MNRANEDRTKLKSMLTALDLDPAEQGSTGVRIVVDGIYATVMFYGDGTLSLVCSVKGDDPDWDLHRINAANNRVRFAKFSVDRGNLLLEADFVFNVSAPEAVGQLSQVLKLWRLALRELQRLAEELVPA